jgi:hypothetical protein
LLQSTSILFFVFSKQTLTAKPGPAVPPPYDMTTDCIVPNHFLPPAKICADDDDQDVSSDAFEEQYMLVYSLFIFVGKEAISSKGAKSFYMHMQLVSVAYCLS